MKKYYLLIILVLGTCLNSFAQSNHVSASGLMAFNNPKHDQISGKSILSVEVEKSSSINNTYNDPNRWRNMPRTNLNPNAQIGIELCKDEALFVLISELLSIRLDQISRPPTHNPTDGSKY